MTRRVVDDIEFRNYIGLDKRSDKTLVPQNNQTTSNNTIIKRGVYLTRPGTERFGSLDDTALGGTRRRRAAVDVGNDTYILLHKGTSLYFGLETDSSFTQIQDVSAVNVVVADSESEFEVRGQEVGSSGDLSLKVLHKTSAATTILEWNGTTWVARNCGIENDMTFTSAVAAGGAAPLGTYRIRLVAQRIINGVRTSESAPTSEDGTTPNDRSWQEVELTDGNEQIDLTVTHSSPDPQITHYMFQITQNLVFLTGSNELTENGNDPTIYFETTPILAATALGGTVTLDIGSEDLNVVAPNLVGYLTIPGHLISTQSGGILFFSGIGEFRNRIYKSGISGYYYHNELYDPFEFFAAGEDDGQALVGLGIVQDHLLILKEGKTAIVPNHDINGEVVYRDRKLGCLSRHAFANISEDQVIVFCQDGIFRVFDGIRYDRQSEIDGQGYPFSENIRTVSETIDPDTLDFVFHEERLHIIHGTGSSRSALALHPRDFMAWTEWTNTDWQDGMLIDNGNRWIFGKTDGRLYEVKDDLVEDLGVKIPYTVTFALLSSQVSRRHRVLMKMVGLDAEFDDNNTTQTEIVMDLGRATTGKQYIFPQPSENTNQAWFQAYFGKTQVYGNYVEVTVTGTGKMLLRGLYLGKIEKRSGNFGWTQVPPPSFRPPAADFDFYFDAGEASLDRSAYDILDAREDTEDRSGYTVYTRM